MTQISDTIFAFKRGTSKWRGIMKNFVRGGVAVLLFSMLFVAIIYAQTTATTKPEAITVANQSQLKAETVVSDIDIITDANTAIATTIESPNTLDNTSDNNKKLVKKTGSAKAAGASKGSFVATAYCLRGRTAMGHAVRRGIIAADPRVLRLGSTITISGGYAGSYLVSDTGGKIKGKRLDIWMPSCAEARRFGRRTVQVFQ